MAKRTVVQDRAIKYFMEENPGYIPQLSPPGVIEFMHSTTKDKKVKTLLSLEATYKQMMKDKNARRKIS